MPLTLHALRLVVDKSLHTGPVEIGCDECFEQLDRFAELHLANRGAAAALPLVEAHIEGCHECREEFEILLTVLRDEARRTRSWRTLFGRLG